MKSVSLREEESTKEKPSESKSETKSQYPNDKPFTHMSENEANSKNEDEDEEIPSEDIPDEEFNIERKIPEAPGSSSISKMALESGGQMRKANTTPQWKKNKRSLGENEETKEKSCAAIVNPFFNDPPRKNSSGECSDTLRMPLNPTKMTSCYGKLDNKALPK